MMQKIYFRGKKGTSLLKPSKDWMEKMDHLTLDNVKELLGTPDIPGSRTELEVLVHWTQMLAQKRGEDYIRKNRRKLFKDWKNILEMGLSRV